ncbi:MAG TPA: biotin transporter BioY [Candidatus Blautia merdavium]|uniref:Biotin transporter n=1 Tax=Candidatus Blautia merdavium TaxID=2838494 RepID=A0A9D2PRX0_9FIRM|nr:biotin transporter BioY [Candidatus Blautia merdavium]
MEAVTKQMNKTHDMVYIGIFAVLIAICSWISIPAAVPFTLQTMGVFLSVGILGGKRGTLAVLVYLLLGAVGIPVFAGFSGGIGVFLQSSGGYLAGFLLSALLMWGMEKLLGRSTVILGISMVLGLLVCYAAGTIWFMAVYTANTGAVGVGTVLAWCVIPFILPDLVKIAVALVLTKRLAGVVRR